MWGWTLLASVSDIGVIGGIQLSDGTYTIMYSITPTGTIFTTTVTITGGTGSFVIPSDQIPDEDNYTITILEWINAGGCSITSNITDTFMVNPVPDAQNIVIGIPDTCDDEPLVITITDMSDPVILIDGVYNIMYDIVGPSDLLNQTVTIPISTGVGSFTLPDTGFTLW